MYLRCAVLVLETRARVSAWSRLEVVCMASLKRGKLHGLQIRKERTLLRFEREPEDV